MDNTALEFRRRFWTRVEWCQSPRTLAADDWGRCGRIRGRSVWNKSCINPIWYEWRILKCWRSEKRPEPYLQHPAYQYCLVSELYCVHAGCSAYIGCKVRPEQRLQMLVRTTATRARCSSVALKLKARFIRVLRPWQRPRISRTMRNSKSNWFWLCAKNEPDLMQDASPFMILQILSWNK